MTAKQCGRRYERHSKKRATINIVGEASTFADTRQKIVDLKPDVLLLDLRLPQKWACALLW